jgi:hypothetical protein
MLVEQHLKFVVLNKKLLGRVVTSSALRKGEYAAPERLITHEKQLR